MTRLAMSAALAALFGWLGGCAGSTPAPTNPPPPAQSGETGHDHESHEHGEHSAESGDVAANLAKLSPEDRAAAEKQRVCPVSDEPLGSMGVPIKVDVKGQSVWICCDGCREDLLAEPDKYLEKLK